MKTTETPTPRPPAERGPLPSLYLLEGTDLRVGRFMMQYLRARQAEGKTGPIPVLGTHAKTGVPMRAEVSAASVSN